jgi:hypothetical protein
VKLFWTLIEGEIKNPTDDSIDHVSKTNEELKFGSKDILNYGFPE